LQILEGEDKDNVTGVLTERWVMYNFYQPPTRRKRRREDAEQRGRLKIFQAREEITKREADRKKRDQEVQDLIESAGKEREEAWTREWNQDDGTWLEINKVTGEQREYVAPEMREYLMAQERLAAWQEGVDETTGRTYYYNPVSNETQVQAAFFRTFPTRNTTLMVLLCLLSSGPGLQKCQQWSMRRLSSLGLASNSPSSVVRLVRWSWPVWLEMSSTTAGQHRRRRSQNMIGSCAYRRGAKWKKR
jgi:hypothetical protein